MHIGSLLSVVLVSDTDWRCGRTSPIRCQARYGKWLVHWQASFTRQRQWRYHRLSECTSHKQRGEL